MTRHSSSVRLALAFTAAVLCALSFCWSAGPAGAQGSVDTPLPAGWELCIMQGLGAPATQANVADLDEWQEAEGGSTNNTAAYNPFNTLRTTDATNAPLPEVTSANGFPAFTDWLAGCSATVATLLQPNMWPVTVALRAGNVSPPGAFLAIVDQSAWCAPSADGQPCYIADIVGAAVDLPTPPHSSALDVYQNVQSDLHSYQQSLTAVSSDQALVTTRNQQLVTAGAAVSVAQTDRDSADLALRKFAVEEYESSGLFEESSFAGGSPGPEPGGPQNADGVISQQYLGIAASNLLQHSRATTDALKSALDQRREAAKALGQAATTLTSDESAEHQALDLLVSDLGTMQTAGACTAVTLVAAPASGSTNTTDAGDGATPTTTTSSTTSTTSTSTTSTTSTTTTTTQPALSGEPITGATKPVLTTTSTTTVPATSTTVPAPTTTTTSTTTPGETGQGSSSSSTPQSANPAAVGAVQGCVSALAPATSS